MNQKDIIIKKDILIKSAESSENKSEVNFSEGDETMNNSVSS